ncbi:MAG: hypothetical protein A3K04_02285 [Gallionellales bacterium RBG_16_56_9]|nr:MAG: hypothetical protein A3K04_02285 [Gallionellales bacterium RBG_16_56_9]
MGGIVVTLLVGLTSLTVHAANQRATEKTTSAQAVRAPVITDAWTRATVPGQPVGGAYMKISSPTPVTLIHVETDAAKEVQVHIMHMDNGVMKMREQGPLAILAGKTVELAPGGLHLMLLGLKQALKAGDTITLKMTFIDANKVKTTSVIKAPVRPIGQSAKGS